MSSPSRVKKRCGSTTICTSASPAGPSAGAGAPLPRRRSDLPVLDARGNGHVERSALGQGDRLHPAVDGVEKGNVQFVVQVGAGRAPHLLPLLLAAAAQKLGENVVPLGEVGVALRALVRVCPRRRRIRDSSAPAAAPSRRPRRRSRPRRSGGACPGSDRRSLAAETSLNRSSACLSPGLRSGCSFLASCR